MNKRWVCNDVWMDIFPSFDRAQLGLKMALLSPRFDALVDKHFDGKTQFTIWRPFEIRKDTDEMPKLFVEGKSEGFPLPDRPLPNKIIFTNHKHLRIQYIDHFVIEFLRSNQQIWDKGSRFGFAVWSDKNEDTKPIWDVFVAEIWPFFASNIRHFCFPNAEHLDIWRRLISPTILSDLNQLEAIIFCQLFPDLLADDDDFGGPNATSAGQVLAKWLHNPKKDGQRKILHCLNFTTAPTNFEWVNNFKQVGCRHMTLYNFCLGFVRARTSVSYSVYSTFFVSTPIEPFELVNEWTNEKLTLKEETDIGSSHSWLLKRCPNIVGETAEAVQKQQQQKRVVNFPIVFKFSGCKNCIGPLSPPEAAAKEASQSSEKGV